MSFLALFSSDVALLEQMQALSVKACGSSNLTTPMTVHVDDVRNNWKPSGFYTPDQLGQIVTLAFATTTGATIAIEKSLKSIAGTGAAVAQALGLADVNALQKILTDASATQSSMSQEGMPFIVALQQAKAGGFTVIEAQGLRRWIVRMLEAADETHRAVNIVNCARPGLLDVLQGLADAVTALINLITAVVGVAVDVAKAAGSLLLKVPDFVGSLIKFVKVLPWIALAFSGYYVAVKTEIIPPRYDPLLLRERQTLKPWKKA